MKTPPAAFIPEKGFLFQRRSKNGFREVCRVNNRLRGPKRFLLLLSSLPAARSPRRSDVNIA
ncbi:hypothetical protein Lser_V15G16128 [Lactuca serriola]